MKLTTNWFICDGEGETTKGNQPYNFAYIIGNSEGILIKRSFMLKHRMPQNMNALYFIENYAYWKEHPEEYITVNSDEAFVKILKEDLDKYDAHLFFAWNCLTDWNFLAAILGEERLTKWFHAPRELSELFVNNSTGKQLAAIYDFCKANNFLTPTGKISCKVNYLIKYFKGLDYEEKHNAIYDCEDEYEIFKSFGCNIRDAELLRYKSARMAGTKLEEKVLIWKATEGDKNGI